MSRRRRHTIVLSDVHLSQAHPHDDDDPYWMRYRRRDYHPDADFEDLVGTLLEACAGEPIEVVFNGDVLDFDAPLVKDGKSTFDEFSLDDAGCADQLRRIVADHPRFFGAAARLLAEGHRMIFVSGNHDLELYWPGVRAALREELRGMAVALAPSCDLSDLEERVRFRTWFHVTEDKIYLEHGSQYDHRNGVPDPMLPVLELRELHLELVPLRQANAHSRARRSRSARWIVAFKVSTSSSRSRSTETSAARITITRGSP